MLPDTVSVAKEVASSGFSGLANIVHDTVNVGQASPAFRVHRCAVAAALAFLRSDFFEDQRATGMAADIIADLVFRRVVAVADDLTHQGTSRNGSDVINR